MARGGNTQATANTLLFGSRNHSKIAKAKEIEIMRQEARFRCQSKIKKQEALELEAHKAAGGTVTTSEGFELWFLKDEFHRDNGPAYKAKDEIGWYQNGVLHRVGGPALVSAVEGEEWFVNGNRHRDDGPAIIKPNGDMEWWLNNTRHKLDGPSVLDADGGEFWYKDNVYHRVGAPAVVQPGFYEEWYLEGELHREDGPAIVHLNGMARNKWFLFDQEYPDEKAFLKAKQKLLA